MFNNDAMAEFRGKYYSTISYVSIIIAISVFVWLYFYSRYGLDFTDESYYAIWISSPADYKVSASQFGSFYNIFYKLLNEDLGALRQVNIIITFLLSFSLVMLVTKSVFDKVSDSFVVSLAISLSLSSGVLFYTKDWLLTPSYNTLALQGLLLVSMGLMVLQNKYQQKILLSAVLIGIGGWVSFMGKPSTGAAIGFITIIYLLFYKKMGLSIILSAFFIASVLAVASAYYIDGSISDFVTRITNELSFQEEYDTGHDLRSIMRLDTFDVEIDHVMTLSISLFVFMLIYLLMEYGGIIGLYIVLFFLLIYCIDSFFLQGYVSDLLDKKRSSLIIISIPIFTVLLFLWSWKDKEFEETSKERMLLGFLLLFVPHAYAFGTSGNYWSKGASAGIFWLVAALIMVSTLKISKNKIVANLLIVGLCTQIAMIALIRHGMDNPYRQPKAISENSHHVEIGGKNSELVLDEGFATYIAQAKKVANESGFTPRTPIIDLTGQSPGILYAMKGKIMGRPWIGGGYPGSNRWAISLLSVEKCEELSSAWLLVEPDGPRSLSFEVVSSFGAMFPNDYTVVGVLETAPGAGGFKEKRKQLLFKPVRSVMHADDACRQKRN